jgi:hypothetical protein
MTPMTVPNRPTKGALLPTVPRYASQRSRRARSTAVGLVVAIPAVALFIYFQGRVAAALADAETLGHVLLAHLRSKRGAQHAWLAESTNGRRSSTEHSDRHSIDAVAE